MESSIQGVKSCNFSLILSFKMEMPFNFWTFSFKTLVLFLDDFYLKPSKGL